MVQSKALSVDDYIAEADETRRPALARIRAIAREVLSDWSEAMEYGMAYYRKGESGSGLANQKGYIAFYAGRGAIERHAEALTGIDCGKGCIRYKNIGKIDFDVVRSLYEDIRAHKG
ncbi:MAG: hypothetical protein JWP35_3911 [Caulobacter sp.]|nr:hypothetical protein [Caulobacter sp.]